MKDHNYKIYSEYEDYSKLQKNLIPSKEYSEPLFLGIIGVLPIIFAIGIILTLCGTILAFIVSLFL